MKERILALTVPLSGGLLLLLFVAHGIVAAAAPTIPPGQSFNVDENSPNGTPVGTVSANDPETGVLTFTIAGGTSVTAFAIGKNSGALTVANSTELDRESIATFQLSIKVVDNEALSDTETVDIDLNNLYEIPPQINPPTTFNVPENSANGFVVGFISASDAETGQGDTLSYNVTGGSGQTIFSVNSTSGQITVANPAALNFETQPNNYTLNVTVSDLGGNQDNQPPITINETNVNEAPTAVNDNATVAEAGVVSTVNGGANSLLQNDTDPDQGPLGVLSLNTTPVTAPAFGSVILHSNGTFSYTHNGSENFGDSFVYQACDPGPLCDNATVNITINPVNDPPLVGPDQADVNEGSNVIIDVLADDSDSDGSLVPGSVTVVAGPASGSTSINATNGKITYTPDTDFFGNDSFTYQVCDNGSPLPAQCSQGLVTVNVLPINDPPQLDLDGNGSGTGFSTTFSTSSGSVAVVDNSVNIQDVDSVNLASASVTLVNRPDGSSEFLAASGKGAVQVDYDPNNGLLSLTGSDTLATYEDVLRSIRYMNVAEAPSSALRQIQFVVDDGQNPSTAVFATVSVIAPAVAIALGPDSQTIPQGGTAQFNVTVTNVGEAPLTNVTVEDMLAPDCDRQLGSLSSGEESSYDCSLSAVASSFQNEVTVRAKDATGGEVSESDTGFVQVANANISIVVFPTAGNPQEIPYLGEATFQILVVNTSEVADLAAVEVSAPLAPACNKSIGNLAAEAQHQYVCTTDEISEGDIVFTASAETQMGDTVQNSAVTRVIVFGISLAVEADPVQIESSGDPVSFTLAVVNQSSLKSVTLMALTSSQYGDLTNKANSKIEESTCQIPQSLAAAGGNYACEFVAKVKKAGPVDVAAMARETGSTPSNDTNAQASVNVTDKPFAALFLPAVLRNFLPDEPNDAPCEAYPILANTQHSFLADDKNDWYQFELTEAKEVEVEVTPLEGQLVVYRGTCSSLTFLANEGSSALRKVIKLVGPQPAGTYFIWVINDGSFNDIDPYALRITTN